MSQQENDYPIDFLITWVDDKDPVWQEQYYKYSEAEGDQRDIRFRDMETLNYLFRGIEKFTPWVNHVFFVTCGQHPEWLNVDHPKLICVDHKDFIPEQYLPTFSSHAIELNLHRIQDLSEHFVYFNDDTFLTGIASRKIFFRDGLPCATAVMNNYVTLDRPPFLVPQVNCSVINAHFQKREVLKNNFWKFYTLKYHKYLLKNIQFAFNKTFPGFNPFHLPNSFLKSTFSEVWDKEYDLLDNVCNHKFRVTTDVNQWLFENWQFCTGQFVPRNTNVGCRCSLNTNDSAIDTAKKITSGNYKMICANDDKIEDFQFHKTEIKRALEQILPEKSSFER